MRRRGQLGSRQKRSRKYVHGSTWCSPQLARSETKTVLTSAPSSEPTNSQLRRPRTGGGAAARSSCCASAAARRRGSARRRSDAGWRSPAPWPKALRPGPWAGGRGTSRRTAARAAATSRSARPGAGREALRPATARRRTTPDHRQGLAPLLRRRAEQLEPVPPQVRPAAGFLHAAIREQVIVDAVRIGDEHALVARQQRVHGGRG